MRERNKQQVQAIVSATAVMMRNIAYLVVAAVSFYSVTDVTGQSTNCTADYMNDLLKQALEVKEQCGLKGRYDCCQV